jgi:hypothetical protein
LSEDLSRLNPAESLLLPAPQFFMVIVLPLFTSFVAALPSVEPVLSQVKKNHAMWITDMAAGFLYAKPTMFMP